jgi:hypothetical protein
MTRGGCFIVYERQVALAVDIDDNINGHYISAA